MTAEGWKTGYVLEMLLVVTRVRSSRGQYEPATASVVKSVPRTVYGINRTGTVHEYSPFAIIVRKKSFSVRVLLIIFTDVIARKGRCVFVWEMFFCDVAHLAR